MSRIPDISDIPPIVRKRCNKLAGRNLSRLGLISPIEAMADGYILGLGDCAEALSRRGLDVDGVLANLIEVED